METGTRLVELQTLIGTCAGPQAPDYTQWVETGTSRTWFITATSYVYTRMVQAFSQKC